jgi:hypothetical protein
MEQMTSLLPVLLPSALALLLAGAIAALFFWVFRPKDKADAPSPASPAPNSAAAARGLLRRDSSFVDRGLFQERRTRLLRIISNPVPPPAPVVKAPSRRQPYQLHGAELTLQSSKPKDPNSYMLYVNVSSYDEVEPAAPPAGFLPVALRRGLCLSGASLAVDAR